MGRKRQNSIWDQFEQTTDSVAICKHCKDKFQGKPSVTRLKKHLSQIKGGGISICTKVPDHIKGAFNDSNKRPRIEPSSISNAISTFSPSQNNEEMTEQEMVEQIGDGTMQTQRIISLEGLMPNVEELRHDLVHVTELVGLKFERNIDKIWSWLTMDKISSIGIYGMGGVGKTALLRIIHNKLRNNSKAFPCVYWVTMSPNFGNHKLQNAIAKIMRLEFSDEDDEFEKAKKLSELLIERKNSVLILDDVWDYVPFDEVGIPIGINDFKLVLITRSFDVCRMIGCERNIKVEPLSEEEGWALFRKKLKPEALSAEVEEIAKLVARECAGLPLMIISMARGLRGVDEIFESRNALEELKGSIPRQDNKQVFQKLKISYDYLNDSTLQQCFLYCALFPEDYSLTRDDIIEYLVVEGIIKEMNSREAKFDKGHSILNRLESASLLENIASKNNKKCVKMHGLMRNMALQIMKEGPTVMVETGKQLEELPNEVECWAKDIARVSLIENNIKEIPSSHLLIYSCLSTLLLSRNHNLKLIADSFFHHLPALKVLDLSDTAIQKLPESISDLKCLTALLLRNCRQLRELPSLEKLRTLKHLELNFTGLERVPKGIELLSNLSYLNLFGSQLKEFPGEILSKLYHLQFLGINFSSENSRVIGMELACLSKLENLVCLFGNAGDFNRHVLSLSLMDRHIENKGLNKYFFVVGPHCCTIGEVSEVEFDREVLYSKCNIGREVLLLEDNQKLRICYGSINDDRGLCLRSSAPLRSLEINYCETMGCLFCLTSSPVIFQSLETIKLNRLNKLQALFSGQRIVAPIFSCLKDFRVNCCHSMKLLFPPGLLRNLKSLEKIVVSFCSEMEIIAEEQEGSNSSNNNHSISAETQVLLPKLMLLKLVNLPKLKSICSEKIICSSLQEIRVVRCKKLKNIPLCLPLPSLQRIWAYPKEWWESVEWDLPSAKMNFEPLCVFKEY